MFFEELAAISWRRCRKLQGLKGRFRICKIECHPLARYSDPGEGAIVSRSIANYIIIEWKMGRSSQNLRIGFRTGLVAAVVQ
jgi:hypothetical protein